MFTLAFEHRHRVLLTRLSGAFTADDIESADAAVMLLMGRHGPFRWIIDFSDCSSIEVPLHLLAQRARQPLVAAGQDRIFVARDPTIVELAHTYATVQREFSEAPRIASSLSEACKLLQMESPQFEAISLSSDR
jgi:hypothetical protein